MNLTTKDLTTIEATANNLRKARQDMLRYGLLTADSAYDAQLKALSNRCQKAGYKLAGELLANPVRLEDNGTDSTTD
jgi:hypothetical protein